ncbi:S9 family peptidase [Edaphobacter sp. 12200R-103]|uniref:alpha/beta hydrolase family protein n=1 Tax=Edaphobacter sp. 12200R-103 TaxID=2703788 RepID=UPI00138B861B|nr:alpha/beta fold hydrolase [Edaphobacter sp. 12200R-103]QHS52756.1 alpha/beta fold hydrolase [Edaphobacter sp. 12200R-103]
MTLRSIFAAIVLSTAALHAQMPASAVSTDPAPDQAAPPSMVQVSVPSHGEQLLGVFYLATGAGPHPTAIVMHGFPGYEQNLDIAQAIRRAGWNVMAVHYRGSWGMKGDFSFTHVVEDADAEVAFLRDPAVDAKYHVDPSRIVLVGHSMGGFAVASAAAHDPRVAGVVMISAWNIAGPYANLADDQESVAVAKFVAGQKKNNLAPLTGCTAESLGHEVFRKRKQLNFLNFAPALASRPVLIVTSNDGLASANQTLYEALRKAGDQRAQIVHFATDHSYSGARIALEEKILQSLSSMATR